MVVRWSVCLGVFAGVVYNSWLLAYLLNPHVLHIGLSSDLEASGQPYNWVFILADVLTAAVMFGIIYLLRDNKEKLRFVALAGYATFALMTAISALLPLHCSADISTCGFQAGQQFGLHDLASGLAALGLFFGLLAAWRTSLKASKLPQYLSGIGLLAWSLLGLALLVATLKAEYIVGIQQLYLILTGVMLWLVPYALQEHDSETTIAPKV